MTIAAPYDARAVANFLLNEADRRKLTLTQLKLYKIIYFAHGWYLTRSGTPLILHDFEAWKHGPVVKVLRDAFGKFGARPINERADKLDIFTGKKAPVEPWLARKDADFVIQVYDAYHIYDPWHLSKLTHEAGSPWDLLWNSVKPVGRLGLRLRNEEIKAQFDGLPRRFVLS